MPVPKNCRQVRFAKTRAVSGFPGETSQLARSRRVALPRRVELAEKRGDRRLDDIARNRPSSCRGARMRVSVGVVASETTTRGIAGLEDSPAPFPAARPPSASAAPRAMPTGNAARSRSSARRCAFLFHLQGAQDRIGNLFALLGGRPGVLTRRERQAEPARAWRGGTANPGGCGRSSRHRRRS